MRILGLNRDNHSHEWTTPVAVVPGNVFGAVIESCCVTCHKRRRCRVA